MADLAQVLRQLPRRQDPNVLLGDDASDDASVYRLSPDRALVQTVDFFTPVVDDPYTFGAIAAANALSDVYAVGGEPLTALNIAAFPVDSLPQSVLSEILRGGADKAIEAGVTIVGGHTIDDPEPKYGMAVTGIVHPERFLSTRGARPGDVLVLTKPLGTGLISTALKRGRAAPADVAQAVRWMTRLNRAASQAAVAVSAHAVTDITGYGLLGHLADMCRASGVGARLQLHALPLLSGALTCAEAGFVPAGTSTNLAAVETVLQVDPSLSDAWLHVAADPQTSGGLLVSLSPADLAQFRQVGGSRDVCSPIGTVVAGRPGHIELIS